jgi:hypothetical protein
VYGIPIQQALTQFTFDSLAVPSQKLFALFDRSRRLVVEHVISNTPTQLEILFMLISGCVYIVRPLLVQAWANNTTIQLMDLKLFIYLKETFTGM